MNKDVYIIPDTTGYQMALQVNQPR